MKCKDCNEPCNKCKKEVCSCKRPKEICYEDGCEQKTPAECVIYNSKGQTSYLKCYLGLDSKTSLKEILETLDYKLCNAFTLNLDSCIVNLLELNSTEVDYKVFLKKLSSYICNQSDKYVKVSPNDSKSGYLNDKISTGKCLQKRIIRDSNNVEKLEIYLDFECLQSEISGSTCIEVDCCGGGGNPSNNNFQLSTNTSIVCGGNSATLTLPITSTCATIDWFRNNILIYSGIEKTLTVTLTGNYFAICKNNSGGNVSLSNVVEITNTGNCACVDNTWVSTGNSRCIANVSEIEQKSNCNNFRWIPGGNACQPICVPQWVETNPINIQCGQILNNLQNVTSYDVCKLYQEYSNQCNNNKQWLEYTGSPDPNAEVCPGCQDCNVYVCTVSGNILRYRNNCDNSVHAEFTLNSVEQICNPSLQTNIEVLFTDAITNPVTGYSKRFRLAGATVRPEQQSPSFNNLNPGSHIVYMKIIKEDSATSCEVPLSFTVNQCLECTKVWRTKVGSEYCEGNDLYFLEEEMCDGIPTGATRPKLIQTNSSTCTDPQPCTDPLPTLTISSNITELCPTLHTASFTAVANDTCDTAVYWYFTPNGGEREALGTGLIMYVEKTVSGIVQAECSSCAGASQSNSVNITYQSVCP